MDFIQVKGIHISSSYYMWLLFYIWFLYARPEPAKKTNLGISLLHAQFFLCLIPCVTTSIIVIMMICTWEKHIHIHLSHRTLKYQYTRSLTRFFSMRWEIKINLVKYILLLIYVNSLFFGSNSISFLTSFMNVLLIT